MDLSIVGPLGVSLTLSSILSISPLKILYRLAIKVGTIIHTKEGTIRYFIKSIYATRSTHGIAIVLNDKHH